MSTPLKALLPLDTFFSRSAQQFFPRAGPAALGTASQWGFPLPRKLRRIQGVRLKEARERRQVAQKLRPGNSEPAGTEHPANNAIPMLP